jgi:1,4-dihydroxy-2-naphthoyl-CoA synthase
MKEEGKAFADLLGSPEAKEAFAAFLEKRKPDFAKLKRT